MIGGFARKTSQFTLTVNIEKQDRRQARSSATSIGLIAMKRRAGAAKGADNRKPAFRAPLEGDAPPTGAADDA